jgi:hypothetical protein
MKKGSYLFVCAPAVPAPQPQLPLQPLQLHSSSSSSSRSSSTAARGLWSSGDGVREEVEKKKKNRAGRMGFSSIQKTASTGSSATGALVGANSLQPLSSSTFGACSLTPLKQYSNTGLE